MKTWKVTREMSLTWTDEVEVEAETEEEARARGYAKPADVYDAALSVNVSIDSVTLIASDDPADIVEPPYLPPLGQRVLPGYEDARAAYAVVLSEGHG